MSVLAAATVLALVLHDRAPLLAEGRGAAPRVAVLWPGQVLEARREQRGFVEVWDHGRERGGWVRVADVRRYPVAPESLPELVAIVRFLRDTPGAEALGIAHAALALKVGEVREVGPELLAAIGTMSDRLARRASAAKVDEEVTAHVEVMASYGVGLRSVPRRDGRTRLCTDGAAWRRALELGALGEARLDAVLALTAPECVDTSIEHTRRVEARARVSLLDAVDPAGVSPHRVAAWQARRAEAWATVAFDRAREGLPSEAAAAAELAHTALARVDRAALADEDRAAYADAAMAVGAALGARASPRSTPGSGLELRAHAGAAPGEICLVLARGQAVLVQRCTYGQPWLGTVTVAPEGRALAVAVSPLPGWRELWLFRPVDGQWGVDVVTPSVGAPELGYVEAAGWSGDGSKLLLAREARVGRQHVARFGVLSVASLLVEVEGDRPDAVSAFARGASPSWRAETVALR